MSRKQRYTRCPDCWVKIDRFVWEEHVCDPGIRLDQELSEFSDEVDYLEREIVAFFLSNEGVFEAYYAKRQRLRVA